jgi:coproporphyrinogen III oxidase-like Fe-S oxidoreductase
LRHRSRSTSTFRGVCANARTATSIRTSNAVRNSTRAYVDALLADLDADLAQFEFARERPIVSVFFGGGTPSLFAPDLIARILDGCRARLRFIATPKSRLETNPGTVEHGRFEGYRVRA